MSSALSFVLFDLDGTLVDTSDAHEAAFRTALERLRPRILPSFRYDPLRGLTTAAAFLELGVDDPDELQSLVVAKREAFLRLVQTRGVAPFPGANDLLAALERARVGRYVVTSASRASATLTLQRTGLASAIEGLIAAEDSPESKPARGPYLAALRTFGLRAEEGLVVEDAISGVRAAQAAGLRVLRVHGRRNEDDSTQWVPDLERLRALLIPETAA